jgi:hypothetical protein
VNVKFKVIILFFVMIGTFISPTFAQQFEEPDYVMRGGEVSGFELDPDTTSLIISLDQRARGELTITLPRNLIDAKIGSEDTDFIILIDGAFKHDPMDEIITVSDRTVTIPLKGYNSKITIIGTQVFSQVTPAPTIIPQQQIEKKIEMELRSEIPNGEAKLLIFSDTKWSGALDSTSSDYTEIVGQNDRSIVFGCEPSLLREGFFGAKIQKMTEDGYLKIVVIQNQKIMAQGSTEAQFGEIIIQENCVSSFGTGTEGGGCLIATAAFGSEISPQVQLLREIRDNTVLQTESGSAFMIGFNQFYYSFSPTVADYERENLAFKEAVKITLTPLLASLTLLQYADIDSESEMLGYGIGVILLNIGMYFVAPAVLLSVCIRKISKN